VGSQSGDVEPGLRGGGPDPVRRGRLVRPLQDPIDVDDPARPDCREGVREIVERRMREVEDDTVDRCDLAQDSAGIAFVRNDSVHAVGADVRAEELDRRRVYVRRMNELRPTSFRDEDGERAYPGEWIGDDFALEDEIRNPFALRGQPGAEIRLGQVDTIAKAVLRVHGRCPPLARDDLDRSNSALALHPAILPRDPDVRVPPENCESNLLAIWLQFFGHFHDGDVANDVERARKKSAQRFRHIDDVFVAPYGHESLVEFPLFGRETDVQTLCRREEHLVSFLDNAEMLLQDTQGDESAPDFFAAFPRHDDTPDPHDSAIPSLPVKDFRTHANPSCEIPSTKPRARLRRKRE